LLAIDRSKLNLHANTQDPIISQAPTAALIVEKVKASNSQQVFCITRTDNRDNKKCWLEERR